MTWQAHSLHTEPASNSCLRFQQVHTFGRKQEKCHGRKPSGAILYEKLLDLSSPYLSHLLLKVLPIPPQLPVISQLSPATAAALFLSLFLSANPSPATPSAAATTTVSTDNSRPIHIAGPSSSHEGCDWMLPLFPREIEASSLIGEPRYCSRSSSFVIVIGFRYVGPEVHLGAVRRFFSQEEGAHHEELAHAATAEHLKDLKEGRQRKKGGQSM